MSSLEVALQTTMGAFRLEAAFQAPGRGVSALFGQSGSGKTTILRCLAGLEQAVGRVIVNGEVWQDSASRHFIPTHRRSLGYVFQEANLLAHLSVRENLEYGYKRLAKVQRRVAFDDAVALLGIETLLERNPARLSGGERQRVAIARALLTAPRLLLMDEPLSALDEQNKGEIIPYLERLHDELGIPVVLVSHSLREVARLADYLVWLGDGRVVDAGPIKELFGRLTAGHEADEDAGALVDAVVALHDEAFHLTELESEGGKLWVPSVTAAPGQRLRVRLPARDISLSLDPETRSSIQNVWRARVDEIVPATAGQVVVHMSAGDARDVPLFARITAKSAAQLQLVAGIEVYARIKGVALFE